MARQRVGRRLGQARAPCRGPGWRRQPTLGVDVGGVILTLADREEDTSFFGTRPLETPAVTVVDTWAELAALLARGSA